MATIIKSNSSSVNVVNGYFKLKKNPLAALNTSIGVRIPNTETKIVGGTITKNNVEGDTATGEGVFYITWTSEEGYILYKPSSTILDNILADAFMLDTKIPIANGCKYLRSTINGLNAIDGVPVGSQCNITGNFCGGVFAVEGEMAIYPFGSIMLDWNIFPNNSIVYRCEFPENGIAFNWDIFWQKIVPSQTQKNYNIKPAGRFVVPNDDVFADGYTWGWDLRICRSDATSINNLIKSVAATSHDDKVQYKILTGALQYATSDVDTEIAALRTRGWNIS